MTTLLAIETSADLASIALSVHGDVRAIELSGSQTHSGGIVPAIQTLFAQAQITLSQCDAIAFGCGPGAFTGVRTACGIVQGMAFASKLPVIPISSLLAMAHQTWLVQPDLQRVSCVLDARMAELYWACYERRDASWHELVAPKLATREEITQMTTSAYQLVVGPQVQFEDASSLSARPHAKDMVLLAQELYAQGKFVSAEDAQPLYVRNKIALTTRERELEKQK